MKKKLFSSTTALFFLLVACNCTGSSQHQTPTVFSDKALTTRANQRQEDKAFLHYLTQRTVQVKFRCDPKENVVIIGLSDAGAKAYGDSRGTGTIVRSREGASYIFTATHVVTLSRAADEKAFDCKVSITLDPSLDSDQVEIPAEVFVSDKNRDLAVLKVERDLGISTDLETSPILGEDIWAIGFPVQVYNRRHLALSITRGTLATLSVKSPNLSRDGYFHRVTSQVYFGNSGGGIWTREGKLVGIVCFLFTDPHKQPLEGYYYVKPVNEVLAELHNAWKYQEVFGN